MLGEMITIKHGLGSFRALPGGDLRRPDLRVNPKSAWENTYPVTCTLPAAMAAKWFRTLSVSLLVRVREELTHAELP